MKGTGKNYHFMRSFNNFLDLGKWKQKCQMKLTVKNKCNIRYKYDYLNGHPMSEL